MRFGDSMTQFSLGPRLAACASLVRPGAVLLDVGTDHAYLPLYLVSQGICPRAVASDVRKGPLAMASRHIEAAGLSDKIETVCTDGLAGLSDRGGTDVVIAGMGGLLIRDILAAAPFVKNPDVALILQPMKNEDALRAYLLAEGFAVTDERLAAEDGKIYSVLRAVWDGKTRKADALSLLLGAENIEKRAERRELFLLLLRKFETTYRKKTNGMRPDHEEYAEAKAIYDALTALIRETEERI
ncbi:MAG: SAM-dependent methyltransferase [Ruminococcus sp.]|nr:SAM-dependent methyltransferase [Candidatus Apopatosoma intestinale]